MEKITAQKGKPNKSEHIVITSSDPKKIHSCPHVPRKTRAEMQEAVGELFCGVNAHTVKFQHLDAFLFQLDERINRVLEEQKSLESRLALCQKMINHFVIEIGDISDALKVAFPENTNRKNQDTAIYCIDKLNSSEVKVEIVEQEFPSHLKPQYWRDCD